MRLQRNLLDGGARPAGRRPVNKRLLLLILVLAVARLLLSHNGALTRYAQSRLAPPPQLDDEQLADAAAMYFSGIGVTQSAAQAKYYWGLAAARGDGPAKNLLGLDGKVGP